MAQKTIDDKFELIAAVRHEIDDGVWFEDDHHSRGKKILEQFLTRIASTDDIIFLTVNSLSPQLRSIAESLAPDILETLAYPHSPGDMFASPSYYAHNRLLTVMFGVGVTDTSETDLRAADDTLTQGLMDYASLQVNKGISERTIQSVVVAITLAAGWLQSPERAQLN